MDKKKSLERLLNPEKIAVIGASNSEFKVGGIVFKRLLGSRRRLFPVNPKETAIQGHKVCPDIQSLPRGIDLAVITISAAAAVEAVKLCIERKIPNYIIVAGGFGETGGPGQVLEDQLKALAKENPINILGPNSLGIFLPDENIDTIFVEHGDKALDRNGTIACIVQSGSIGTEALGYASNTGYGMRAFIGLGNKCDLDENDFLDYFGRDKRTNCLGFYLENIENGRLFLKAAQKISKKKPVVVLKAGTTHTAVTAVTSHTGKLAGSDNVIAGAFKQYGIQRVYDDEAFCDATRVLSMICGAPGNRVAVLTGAGGYGVMCTDFIEKKSSRVPLVMARLSEQTKKRIKADTFSFASCENPVDLTASAGDLMYSKSLDALIADQGVDIIICIVFFSPPGVSENLIDIIVDKSRHTDKPVIVFTKYGPFTDNRIKNFYHAGVVAFPSIGRAVRAARFLVERSKIKNRFALEKKS
ncbi:MAG: CoA-binding protein [Pseudomonadota bacterium]